MKKRMFYIFLLGILASSASLLIQRIGDCGPLAWMCPDYYVRGYPVQIWASDTMFDISFALVGFLVNALIYFSLIYLIYFGYEFVINKVARKK